MADHHIDLLVIGAGASGSSVAFEAVQRGLSVALLDAGDIGGGTSCRSTKLLHGGVRYLELAFKTLDFAQLRLVREALLERSHWLKRAPFLAHRLELALPTHHAWGQAYYRLGLGLYDALAGQRGIGHSRLLSGDKMRDALPQLKSCQGGVAYSDGQFNDARLNLLLALTAERMGATLRTRCRVVDLEHGSGGRLRAVVSESASGARNRWCASVIVNATGIGADAIRLMADPSATPRVLTSRGSHIVLRQNLCPGGLGLLVPSTADGRVLFMLPFFGRTLVGTTDEVCPEDSATLPSVGDETYLLNYVREWFPGLQQPDVSSLWAGGRPLLKAEGEGINSSRVVREHEVEILPCGLVSVMGGKWTTCRPMALDAIAAVERQLGRSLPVVQPMALLGASDDHPSTMSALAKQRIQLEELIPDGPQRASQIQHLQRSFGLEALALITEAAPQDREPLSDVIPLCKAEIIHSIRMEHAGSATDVLARRSRLAMVDLEEARRLQPLVEACLNQTGVGSVSTSPISHQLNP